MGELTSSLVVTAFFSEGCDACVSMDPIVREFGRIHSDIPVFISQSETLMDQFNISATPCLLFSFTDRSEYFVSEGLQNVSEIEQSLEEISQVLRYNDTTEDKRQ